MLTWPSLHEHEGCPNGIITAHIQVEYLRDRNGGPLANIAHRGYLTGRFLFTLLAASQSRDTRIACLGHRSLDVVRVQNSRGISRGTPPA